VTTCRSFNIKLSYATSCTLSTHNYDDNDNDEALAEEEEEEEKLGVDKTGTVLSNTVPDCK
jgi:hypothetical protein